MNFDAEQFVMHRLGQLERTRSSRLVRWMVGLGLVKRSIMSSYSSKLYPDCADGLLAKTRIL